MSRELPEPSPPPGATSDLSAALRALTGAVDDTSDALFDHVRGRRWVDTAAALLSNISDYGVVWVAVAAIKARRGGQSRRQAVVALGLAGIASYGVNRALKAAVGRARPDHTPARTSPGPGEPASTSSSELLAVRRPTSTSFPSGHTLAAFCTAQVLGDSPAGRSAGLALASAVALSRVHLRAHHASDVVGGAIVGAALGAALRPVVATLAGTTLRRGTRPRKE